MSPAANAAAFLALVLAAGACGGSVESERASSLAEQTSAEIDAALAEARALLTELEADPALRVVDPEQIHGHPATAAADTARKRQIGRAMDRAARRCTRAVRKAADAHPQYRAIGRATVESIGGVDCISRPARTPLHVGDEVFFLRAYAGVGSEDPFAVGDYRFDGRSYEQYLPVGLGAIGAVLFAELRLGPLWGSLAAIERGEGADIVVTDANGTIIARPALPYWVGRSLAGRDELIDAMLERHSGSGTFEVEGRERLYVFDAPEAANGQIRVAAGVPK